MVKKKVATKKKLMPHREVKVKSRAYGEHTRAARGSKTPVGLNEAFTEHNAKTVTINNTAKRVHDLLKHCGKPFKEKMLWQVMLSRMRKAASMAVLDLLRTLKEMELNSKYPLERFAHPHVMSVEWDKKSCEMVMSKGYPHWKFDDTEYCFEVFLLTLGKDVGEDGLVSARSEWMKKEDVDGEMKFGFVVPDKLVYYLVCLHFMTGKDRKETGMLANRGMRIVEVGKGNSEFKKK